MDITAEMSLKISIALDIITPIWHRARKVRDSVVQVIKSANGDGRSPRRINAVANMGIMPKSVPTTA